MCLYTSNITPLIATEPIRVWKRLIKTDNGFETPYRHIKVKVNESLKALYPDAKIIPGHLVDIQGVHAYRTQKEAEIKQYSYEIITEWEIPAGAKYWLGTWYAKGEIAATEMKFIKICGD